MDSIIRNSIVKWLKNEGYLVEDISSGSGVPALSRLLLTKNGQTQSCVSKLSKKSGRMGFNRKENGNWDVLTDSDLVAYGFTDAQNKSTALQVQLYDARDIEEAFETTRLALKAEGKEGYQIWLAPFKEKGTRFLGSGYQSKALIENDIPLSGGEVGESLTGHEVSLTADENSTPYQRAKMIFAKSLGVEVNCIELEVRIRK